MEDKIKTLKEKFSIAHYNLIVGCSDSELQLYLYLKLYAVNKNYCFPGFVTILEDLKWSKWKLQNTIQQMESSGRMRVKRKQGKGNIYDISFYDKVREGKRMIKNKVSESGLETSLTCLETSPERKEINKELLLDKSNNTAHTEKYRLEDIRKVVDHFFIINGVEPKKNPTYKRHLRSAKSLLQCAGSAKQAVSVLNKAKDWARAGSFSWTIDTVVKHYPFLLNFTPRKEQPALIFHD